MKYEYSIHRGNNMNELDQTNSCFYSADSSGLLSDSVSQVLYREDEKRMRELDKLIAEGKGDKKLGRPSKDK